MLLWGCVVVSMAFVKNFGGLLTCATVLLDNESGLTELLSTRFFLGLTEVCCPVYLRIHAVLKNAHQAGLFPGVTFYLSVWYPRAAQAQRMGLFLAAGTGAGAFGGLFAFAIEKMEG